MTIHEDSHSEEDFPDDVEQKGLGTTGDGVEIVYDKTGDSVPAQDIEEKESPSTNTHVRPGAGPGGAFIEKMGSLIPTFGAKKADTEMTEFIIELPRDILTAFFLLKLPRDDSRCRTAGTSGPRGGAAGGPRAGRTRRAA